MSAYTTLYVSVPAARGCLVRAIFQATPDRLENFLNYVLQDQLYNVQVSGDEPLPDDKVL